MAERLLVGTRKGLFTLRPDRSGGWAIDDVAFLGDPVSMLLPDRRDGRLYAGLALGHFGVKLHRSDDGGHSWQELPAPAFPEMPDAEKAPAVSLIWSLEAGGPDEPGVIWAGTIPGGLFRSADHGQSWMLNRPLWDVPGRSDWFGGGYDHPGIHSVCVDPRDSRRVTVGISCGGVWATEDGGERWQARTTGMHAEYMPPQRRDDPAVQDPHRVVQCAAGPEVLWTQHHNGVFRSTDGARSWHEVTAIRPSKFGFAVAVHPRDPDRAWFVPGIKDERRVPVDGALVVARTGDGGRSFEVLSDGLPQAHAYDLVYRHGLAVDDSGDLLAMGSTTGNLWLSDNGGDRWASLSRHLPPIACVRFAG